MGRAKLKMELIENEKSRVLRYKKRKEGLIKKLHQLTTLCDVGACMIIDGAAVTRRPGLEIWPVENSDEVRRLISLYESKGRELGSVKTYGLYDFFKERQKEVEGNLEKLRKKNSEAKYPTWDNNLNSMDESQLRFLAANLQKKAQSVRSRIELLKMRDEQVLENMKNMMIVENFSQFRGYQDMGYMNMMQTSGAGGGFAAAERPVMYDALASPQLAMIAQQECYAPSQLPEPYMVSPMSSYAAVAPLPPAGMQWVENMNYRDDDDDLDKMSLRLCRGWRV